MSHELRTPLNAIIGFSDMLALQVFGPIGHDRYVQYARDIHHSGHHLLQVISDILDLSKIEAGKLELVLSSVDPVALVEDAVRMTEATARSCGVAVTFDVDQSIGAIAGDETKLRQVVLNLLSNAIKFTPREGQVVVTAI